MYILKISINYINQEPIFKQSKRHIFSWNGGALYVHRSNQAVVTGHDT